MVSSSVYWRLVLPRDDAPDAGAPEVMLDDSSTASVSTAQTSRCAGLNLFTMHLQRFFTSCDVAERKLPDPLGD
jgi:hypothetical protein